MRHDPPVQEEQLEIARPLYVVTFTGHEGIEDEPPVLLGPQRNVGGPHLLAPEAATVIPALWYALHLPQAASDTMDLSARVLRFMGAAGTPAQILYLPLAWLSEEVIRMSPFADCDRMRIDCPADELEEARERTHDLGFKFEPIAHNTLDDARLEGDWDDLREYWRGLGVVPNDGFRSDRLSLRPIATEQVMSLALARTTRQMERATDAQGEVVSVECALKLRALVNTLGRFEQDGIEPGEAADIVADEVGRAYRNERVPVSVVLPGMPRAYAKALAKSSREAAELVRTFHSATAEVEAEAFAVIAAGSGVQHEALALVLPEVPANAWVRLAELEQHWVDAARPPVVRRLLARLNRAAEPLWSNELVSALKHASVLRVATNFPIGLLTVPGDTAPLSFCLPIAYQPLVPLTRRLQRTFQPVPDIDLAGGFTVLVVECIPASDRVGALSRRAWDAAEHIFEGGEGAPAVLHRRDAQSITDLRDALNELRPDILVLSGHGFSDPVTNTAGVAIGSDRFLGLGLDYLPRAVLFSSCHVSPRGIGQVTVVDLLLQQGVIAVLGTQVPVDVRHNAVLMARLFVYIREALAGTEPGVSLLEAWHRTVGGNPLNDVVYGNDRLGAFAGQPYGDGVVLTEFMLHASSGRLRRGHVYEDTEHVLIDMAAQLDVADKVSNWLRDPGYLPESAMYAFYGHPDRIRLAPHPTL